ncbi:hypothetical protein BVG16_31645 [Paenibacillus selenitireducens]|uniref:Uncharacterized protein n=1 Tax=Paenibacillus selenitireducens TaxID=1324314 RepID=A0A1T2WZ30_9BACL|nr:SEC-C metal-binding domain-containing protein [Paenibacillus selenitireducens]OPA72872.1 hypothetical protein BVG16_31645 [Paenibacillus selenitireducens]
MIHNVGRNDPCPCGSGKKFKKCCMNKSQEEKQDNKIIIPVSQKNAQSVNTLVEGWFADQPSYRMVADHVVSSMTDLYSWEQITEALHVWHAYTNQTQPTVRKAETLTAALEYYIAQAHGYDQVTQSSLATKYGVSSGTISKWVQQIRECMDEHPCYDPLDQRIPQLRHMLTEQKMQHIDKLLAEQKFSSVNEAKDYMLQLINQGKISQGMKTETIEEEAQEILYEAWEEPSPSVRTTLAKKALELDPNNSDAFNILAESATTAPEQSIGLYEEGMRVGLASLGTAFIHQNKGRVWDSVRIRPYLRSKAGFARKCMELGRMKESILHNEELIALDAADHLHVHNPLITAFIEMKQLQRAASLIDSYNADPSISFAYNRVLVEYEMNGISDRLSQLWTEAQQKSPETAVYLLSTKKLPTFKSESVQYVLGHRHLWEVHAELLQWAKKQ